MEHLLYQTTATAHEAVAKGAYESDVLQVSDWDVWDTQFGPVDVLEPKTRWLGFEHDSHQPMWFKHRASIDVDESPIIEAYSKGWNLDAVWDTADISAVHGSLKGLSKTGAEKQLGAFCQAWLYLGLLECVLEKELRVSYLTRLDSNFDGPFVYSRNIPPLLAALQQELQELDTEARQSRSLKIRQNIDYASAMLFEILSTDDGSREGTRPAFKKYTIKDFPDFHAAMSATAPAIIALHEAVTQSLYLSGDETAAMAFPGYYEDIFVKQEGRLRARGWCPFVTWRFRESMPASVLMLVDAAKFENSIGGHEKCTEQICDRNSIDTKTYKPSHECVDSDCRFVKPDLQDVMDILDSNRYPVVKLTRGEIMDVQPVTLDEGGDYFAISHVWADGLGSTTEVGIPLCQAQRLQQLCFSAAGKETPFWLDSLCVPAEVVRRRIAITQMNRVYKNATGVITVDSGIRQLSEHSSLLSKVWTIAASGWMQRLWTYQESVIAKSVHFETKNGLLEMTETVREAIRNSTQSSPIQLAALLVEMLPTHVLDVGPSNLNKEYSLAHIMDGLRWRSSSRSGDQAIVASLLMHLNVANILRSDEQEDRFAEFYTQIKTVPWTVIFDRRPKMKRAGFAWAPETLMSWTRDTMIALGKTINGATVTPQGLKITLTILRLEKRVTMAETEPKRCFISVGATFYEIDESVFSSPSRKEVFFDSVIVHHYHYNEVNPASHLATIVMEPAVVGLVSDDWLCLPTEIRCDYEIRWNIRRIDEEDIELDYKIVKGEWVRQALLLS
jgi:hypothetical protein